MTSITSSGASDTESARNCTSGWCGRTPRKTGVAATAGQVHIEQHHVGQALADELDGGGGLVRLADDLHRVTQLRLDAGPEDRMVLDEEDAGPPAGLRAVRGAHVTRSRRGMESWTSAPSPGAERITAEPPTRATRARIDCAMPWRSSGTASGSKPRPRSRT